MNVVSGKEPKNMRIKIGMAMILAIVVVLSFIINEWRSSKYNRTLGINMVVFGDRQISLYAIRPLTQTLYALNLPSNLMVKLYDTGAEYPIVSLLQLKDRQGSEKEFVTRSISETLGINVPIYISGKGLNDEMGLNSRLGSLVLEGDLGWFDRLALRSDITRAVRSGKVINYDMKSGFLDKNVDPDGEEFVRVNLVFAEYIREKFAYEELYNENLVVSVYNASDSEGVALSLSRVMESSGLKVVQVERKKLQIDYDEKYCMYTSMAEVGVNMKWYLQKYLDCAPIENQIKNTGENTLHVFRI
jgi:hypothetical protein